MIEFHRAFKHIQYTDKTHTYYDTKNKKPLMSVTKFLKSISPEFNSTFWSVLKAFEFSGWKPQYKGNTKEFWASKDNESLLVNPYTVNDKMHFLAWENGDGKEFSIAEIAKLNPTPEQVREEWRIQGLMGTERGTYIHNYLENLEKRITDSPPAPNFDFLPTHRQVKFYQSVLKGKELAERYVKETEFLVPVLMEYVIGDSELGLAGRFDRLYYNENSGELEIWDFKTDKKIAYSNKYEKFKCFDLDVCEFNKYSLQTSLYKYIIERNTGLSLGDSYIVHFDVNNDGYDIIKTTNLIHKFDHDNWTTYIKP